MGEAQKPTSHDHADSFQSSLICSFGGILRKLPHSVVKSIEPIKEIAELPFSQTPLEGIMVGQDSSALPIFDFSCHLGGANAAGDYAVNIESSKGAIRLRANGIPTLNASSFPNQEEIPFATSEIEEMLQSFAATEVKSNIHNREVVAKATLTRPLLITRVNNTHVAFDAAGVDFMERHLQSTPIAPDQAQRVITLQNGELVQAISLSVALKMKDAQPTSELWSIGFTHNDTRTAITVSQVIGFENIPLSLFHKLDLDEEFSIWINHPKYGPIKTFNSELLNQKKSNAINQQIWTEIKNLSHDKDDVRKVAIIQKALGLGIKFDGFNLVFPQELIKSVQDTVLLNSLKKESVENSCKSFDLMKISEGSIKNSETNQSRRAISIDYEGKNIFFLASEIYEPSKEALWHSVPCLPQKLSKFIQGIRVQDGLCELLLKPNLLSAELKSDLDSLAEQTFCGWLIQA